MFPFKVISAKKMAVKLELFSVTLSISSCSITWQAINICNPRRSLKVTSQNPFPQYFSLLIF